MLLDIGAKTSNLLFFEKGKVYSRSINLGANSITQDFSAESRLKFDTADKIKIEEGFVSLGGAYEEPENPNQAAISKIARQFMTRLHIQVNQTMQFYRGQQGGSQPVRLFLSGGASIMPYTAQFFAEKLNVPVEYFNPFRNVQIDPAVALEDLVRVAHSMGEVVGLGLRNLAHCPVELNLMPDSIRKWRAFNEKKPFLIATVFTMVVVVAVVGLLFGELKNVKQSRLTVIQPKVDQAKQMDNRFKTAIHELQSATNDMGQIAVWLNDRYYWVDSLPKLRDMLTQVESATKKKWETDNVGIWIEEFVTATPTTQLGGAAGANTQNTLSSEESAIDTKYNLGTSAQGGAPGAPQAVVAVAGQEGTSVTIVCRAIKGTTDSANSELMYALLDAFKASPLIDAKGTQVGEKIISDDSPYTFTFAVKLALKNPLKF